MAKRKKTYDKKTNNLVTVDESDIPEIVGSQFAKLVDLEKQVNMYLHRYIHHLTHSSDFQLMKSLLHGNQLVRLTDDVVEQLPLILLSFFSFIPPG